MSASNEEVSRTGQALRLPVARLAVDRQAIAIVLGFILGTLLLRLPTFFEPPWHTDEGIFEAVAQRVLSGGQLYLDAWESKPPLFLYIYVAIVDLFGAGVLPLRLVTAAFAIGSELTLFCIAMRFMSRRQALLAAGLLAVLLAVPFWEGNLAVADSFALLPSCLAVLCVIKSNETRRSSTALLLLAGVLFGVAFLIRQTFVVVAVALLLWQMLDSRPWPRSAVLMAIGGAGVVLPIIALFAIFGSFYWFWDANVGFFFNYIPSGRELPFDYRPVIALPTVVAIGALLWYRRRGELPGWSLAALWLVLSLAAALLTGRPYSHYLLQVFPPLALLVALIAPHVHLSWRPQRRERPALALAGALALLWSAVVVPAFDWNPAAMRYAKAEDYYGNFASWAVGLKSREDYNRYFDKRVNLTQELDQTLERLDAEGDKVYVWGEYPWVYSLAGTEPALPYMTSFYVLLIPYLDVELSQALRDADPRFIIVMVDAWPRVRDESGIGKQRYYNATRAINGLIAQRYEQVAAIGRAHVFERTTERPLVTERRARPPAAQLP